MLTLRNVIYVLGAVAVVTLVLLNLDGIFGIWGGQAPDLGQPAGTVVTWLFWGSFVLLLVALYRYRDQPAAHEVEVEGPAFARFLFSNSAAGLFWLPIRLFLGLSWLESGLHKLGDPGWTQGGSALLAYWQRAAAIPDAPARPPISYDWYRDFINFLINGQHEGWFALLITAGEITVGLGLLLGALTGIAAFFGAFMNMSFLLAGSASTNPVLFTMAVGLMLAWKVAGYYGLDRWLLPRLGTPWRPGAIFARRSSTG